MRNFDLPGRSPVYAMNGMAATSHPLATATAVRMLQDGGNAVDAAIAAAAVLGLAEPAMTGIGGDCFVLLKPPGDERILALNGSGRAPAGLSAATLRGQRHAAIPDDSADAVTLPGAVDAFCRLSADWGRQDLAASLAPAIRYAEDGVPVAPRVARDWQMHGARLTGTAARYYLTGGKAPEVGQIFRHPRQAEVLRRIARDGRDAFYAGEIADDMLAALVAAGGSQSAGDFVDTEASWSDPIAGGYRGVDLVEHPPNGQGATAILLLKILGHFDIASLDPWGAPRAHLEAEATKLAHDARNRFLADPDHVTRLDHMLSDATAGRLAALIDPSRAMPEAALLTESIHRDTVYLTVVDRERMAVSLIYSIYHAFGSGITSDRFGILLQNRGAGFTLTPGHPNEAGPGKRPLHTIIPAMLARDGRVEMPFGVMGGAYQPTGHARVVSNLVDYGLDPQAAIDGPRCFADTGGLMLESGYAESVKAELAELGHTVLVPDGPLGGAQGIRIDLSGVLVGASDPRKDGCALGY